MQSAKHGQDLATQAQQLLYGGRKGKEREVDSSAEIHDSNAISDNHDFSNLENKQDHNMGLEPDLTGAAQPEDTLMQPPSTPFSVP